jgi:hypothetical protein
MWSRTAASSGSSYSTPTIRTQCSLSTRKRAVAEAIYALKVERPAGHHPDEILAMLDAVPDLRPSLHNATEQELADLLAAFDVTIGYGKPNRRLTLTATIGPGLMPTPENDDDRPEGRSLMFGIAGAGLILNLRPALWPREPSLRGES